MEAVIGEDRLSVEQIVHSDLKEIELPSQRTCQPLEDEASLRYVIRQSRTWGGPVPAQECPGDADGQADRGDKMVEQWELELGEWLKHMVLFKYLLEVFHTAELRRDDPLPWIDLVDRLIRKDFSL